VHQNSESQIFDTGQLSKNVPNRLDRRSQRASRNIQRAFVELRQRRAHEHIAQNLRLRLERSTAQQMQDLLGGGPTAMTASPRSDQAGLRGRVAASVILATLDRWSERGF